MANYSYALAKVLSSLNLRHRSSSGCTHRYGVISRVSVSLIMCTGGA